MIFVNHFHIFFSDLSNISNMAANYLTPVQESDLYEAIKRDVLIDLRDWLVRKLSIDHIIPYLRSKRILDQYDEENIRAEKTTIQKNSKLLDLVDSRGSKGFDQFCHAIKERCTGQVFVLDKILIEFEKRKQERSKTKCCIYNCTCQVSLNTLIVFNELKLTISTYTEEFN